MSTRVAPPPPVPDRATAIVDAALDVMARDGIRGVSMRAVATAAGVSLGLANYHFTDKTTLIAAVLRRVGDRDLDIVRSDGATPVERLRAALRRVGDREFLRPDYLALRLQLWSLAAVDPTFAEINRTAQLRYRDHLVDLIEAARPHLDRSEATRRAADILVIQNGIWLTAAIIDDNEALQRSIHRCERLALARPATSGR